MSLPENFICPITQDIMTDPVICSDGITYEKNAIVRWLQSNNTSPVTRKYISNTLIPNIALRNTIQDYIKDNQKKINYQNQQNVSSQMIQNYKPPNITCDNSYFFQDEYYHSMLTLKFSHDKRPTMIFAVVDTSGSMRESADVSHSAESSGLSRLDLVKHTLKTFVHSLNDTDKMCIIKFSNIASVISDLKLIDHYGRQQTLECIDQLQPDGMTNLWDGITTCINKIKDNYDINYNISMIVMTDGVSNSDPLRGIIPSLTDIINKTKLNFTINTFGYGYNIDSNLLEKIAFIGSGIFGFIPDATMVGTVFVNMISNIINSTVNNLTIIDNNLSDVELITPKNMGMIIIDQPVHIIYRSKNPFVTNIICDLDGRQFQFELSATNPKTPTNTDLDQYYRLFLIKILKDAINTSSYINLINLREKLQSITQTDFIKDLIDDIYFDDENKGQLYKALSNPKWFQYWGKHYLKSIIRAHELMKCITFKEQSPRHYVTDQFKIDQSRIEQIFCILPAPVPLNVPSYVHTNPTHTPVSMSTFYNQSGG